MKIKIKKLNPKAILPKYMTKNSVGMDLYACIENSIILKPFKRVLVSTGIAISLPEGYEAQIRPRSGLAYKHGIFLLNSPGTIDSDYRGEIKIILCNLGEKNFIIKNGDRIAQMVINRIEKCEWLEVDEIDLTERGKNGFGSTGI